MQNLDVIGHESQMRYLSNIVRQAAVPHAFLFTGPQSVGRSVVASWFAKNLLCIDKTKEGLACNYCQGCKQFNGGGHPDFKLVQSNGSDAIKIEQIKELQKFLQLRPHTAANKVCLIRDADSLTSSAQNALLKILEEPPEYVIMILVAKSSDSVLDTIASRCREMSFGLVPAQTVHAYMSEHDKNERELDFLLALFYGQIGTIMTLLDDQEAVDELHSKVRMINRLAAGSVSDRIEQVNQLKLDSMQDLRENIHLLYCLWDMSLNNGQTDEIQNEDISSFLERTTRIPHRDIVNFLEKIQNLEMSAKPGVNYQLQFEGLILQMPH